MHQVHEDSFRMFLGFLIAFGLSWHGLKRNSLNLSGAKAAFLVGFVAFAVGYRFGVMLILVYYTCSKLTKVNEVSDHI